MEWSVRHRLVLDVFAAAAIGDGLPVELLPRAVDRTIGVDQGRARKPAFAVALLVKPVGVEGEVVAVTPNDEVLVVLPVELVEAHPAVVAGPQPLNLVVAAPVVVTVERDRHTIERATARPRACGHLIAALDLAGHQHQVREDEALGHNEVVALREVGSHGGHHQVGAGLGQLRHVVAMVRAIVRGRRQLHHPLGIGRAGHDLLGLTVVRLKIEILGTLNEVDEVVAVGPKMQGRQVAMIDLNRAPAGAVGGHRCKAVRRRLDRDRNVGATLTTDAAGVAVAAGDGGGTGPHQRIGVGFGTDKLGQHRLAHRPPAEARVEPLLHGLEMAADGEPVASGAEGGVKTAKSFETGLQRSLQTVAARVPGLEIFEECADLHQWVNRSIIERDRGRCFRVACDQDRGIQPKDIVGLGRAPQ